MYIRDDDIIIFNTKILLYFNKITIDSPNKCLYHAKLLLK